MRGGTRMKEEIINSLHNVSSTKISMAAVMSAAFAAISTYLERLLLPLAVLTAVMAADYISGMIKAWVNFEISSRTGIKGIVKKLCYILLVTSAACMDYLLSISVSDSLDITGSGISIALVVCVWLIINELISILENLAAMGIPIPDFLNRLALKLKQSSEKNISSREEDDEN